MIKIESGSSSNKKSKRIGTTTITFVLAFSVAALVASGVSYGARPLPPTVLNLTVCGDRLHGVWTDNTCTIPEGTSSVVSRDRTDSGLTISNGVTLNIQGSLTIDTGAIIVNSGTIIVKNVGGVSTPFDESVWGAGILVLGTLNNSGAITIENESANTEGITVSVSYRENDPSDPNPFVVVPGTLNNSNTITIQNRYKTRGIKNLGTIANSASGTITVANSDTTSVGIYNRRDDLLNPKYYYVGGTMTNAGSITISNSGDYNGYGIYNVSLFTNSATGTFTIDPGSSDAGGFYNAGSFTNYGTFTNNRGTVDTLFAGTQIGSYNNNGTMINYGTTYAGTTTSPGTGTFYNEEGASIMINLGKITSHGIFADLSYGATMINYGTFYNYGLIGGGTNKGICIDEPGASGC